jgi:hypothetical protein
MKEIINFIIAFFKNIRINSHIMIILSFYIGALLFSFIWLFEYTLIDLLQLIAMFLFSFAIFTYTSDNYKFSKNKFIF